ncbi:hypothetical protein M878_12055 [Streptomyces roseochromogenus subsp. oscitans DS 12.976]|uniref:Uncharacterized protein n=1 Tax=Streptomyces roseochromogenus subsp. oscitans DS 12.976 TaxID=1352936 RepID=V6KP30_STRRC|nr:hypothetical protein M878_12055 [Streptomyces roseochromogenus subsp. oscitans DS 12.976]
MVIEPVLVMPDCTIFPPCRPYFTHSPLLNKTISSRSYGCLEPTEQDWGNFPVSLGRPPFLEVPAAHAVRKSWAATITAVPLEARITEEVIGRQHFGVFRRTDGVPDAIALA